MIAQNDEFLWCAIVSGSGSILAYIEAVASIMAAASANIIKIRNNTQVFEELSSIHPLKS